MNKEMRNIKTGYGTMSKSDGSKYVGEIVEGKPHGYGTLTSNGGKYVGEIVDGLPHGYGTMISPVDVKYKGMFKYGKLHGVGTITFPNGDKVEGNYRKGIPDGDLIVSNIKGETFVEDGTKFQNIGLEGTE